jgi:OHCU decarboxylase
MHARQPFADAEAMQKAADEIWWSLTTEDWLEAFSKHPRIGQNWIGENAIAKWSAEEQSGMSKAGITTAEAMARLNVDYADKFGFIFIVCAAGKSAEEMLELLEIRFKHSRGEEIAIAAAEQAKITHLRLDKLLGE